MVLQAESGSGLRESADALRKELESARATMSGAIPSATHDVTLGELKQVLHPTHIECRAPYPVLRTYPAQPPLEHSTTRKLLTPKRASRR